MKPLEAIRNTAGTFLIAAVFGAAFWHCLTGTLNDMARQDCQAGVIAACSFVNQLD